MTRFIIRWVINAIALYAAVVIVNGTIGGLALQNPGWLRPVLTLLTCPLILLTLGLFSLILNTFLFYLVGYVGSFFNVGFTVNNFWAAFLGAIIVSVVSVVLSAVFRDELHHR